MGRIEKLQKMTAKGQPPLSVDRLRLLAEQGIEGDRFCDGGDRQVSILGAEVAEWMRQQEVQGLCFRRYKGNVLLAEENLAQWRPGDVLTAAEAELTVTSVKEDCFPECPRRRAGLSCRLPGGCAYARVTRDGWLSVGDALQREQRG